MRVLGVFLIFAALWGGSLALNFVPEYLRFASFASAWLIAVMGVILIARE